MKGGTAKHEVGGRLADLGAVLKQSNMVRLGVLTAFSKTMIDGFHADFMALLAVVDALLRLLGQALNGGMRHDRAPYILRLA